MPDNTPRYSPLGLALMVVFNDQGQTGYTILHSDGSPLTYDEGVLIMTALAALEGRRMIGPPPVINT